MDIFTLTGEFEWSFPLLGWLGLIAAALTSIHVILRKRDTRSAIAWMGLIWLSPFVGALVYLVFGVNRIQRHAQAMRPPHRILPTREALGANIAIESASLLRLGDSVTGLPAVGGNSIEPLFNGDQAYPEMLKAIDNARFTVSLGTYIFDYDEMGLRFADALEAAVKRGVQVRVLIDDAGSRYSKKRMDRILRRRGVPVARFLPIFGPKSFFFMNLRLHRKIMVVDGMVAFTGGMNIRSKHVVNNGDKDSAIRDMHFRVRGPVVADLQQVFAGDWEFATKEKLDGSAWFPALSEEGPVLSRCVEDGPDRHFENARWILLGAISGATRRIRIMTPYFVPDARLITALNTASLRGIQVQIVLPERNNLPWVKWASNATLPPLLERGCEVYFSPPPFDHSKLMTVDDRWTFFGSVNWDERSLRLNFEVNVEAFDTGLTLTMNDYMDSMIARSWRMTSAMLANRSFGVRLRDGFMRLFSPYL